MQNSLGWLSSSLSVVKYVHHIIHLAIGLLQASMVSVLVVHYGGYEWLE